MLRLERPIGGVKLLGEVQDVRAYLTDEQSQRLDGARQCARHRPSDYAGTTREGIEWQVGRFTMEYGSGRLVAQEVSVT
jgi:hypothetical protein